MSSQPISDDLGRNGQRVLKDVHDMLRAKFGMYFSTLQVEEACLDEASAKAIDVTRAGDSPAAYASGKALKQKRTDR